MDQNNTKPIGELFETIQFFSDDDVNNLIENLDNPELRDTVIKNINKLNPLMYQITEYLRESKKA